MRQPWESAIARPTPRHRARMDGGNANAPGYVPMQIAPRSVPDSTRPEVAWRIKKFHAIRFLYRTLPKEVARSLSDAQVQAILNAASPVWGQEELEVEKIPWIFELQGIQSSPATNEIALEPSQTSRASNTPILSRESKTVFSAPSNPRIRRSTDMHVTFKKRKLVMGRPHAEIAEAASSESTQPIQTVSPTVGLTNAQSAVEQSPSKILDELENMLRSARVREQSSADQTVRNESVLNESLAGNDSKPQEGGSHFDVSSMPDNSSVDNSQSLPYVSLGYVLKSNTQRQSHNSS